MNHSKISCFRYDGLATFTRFILCRDWLGGWLMPQQRSYFALKLQKGWWVLGMDCALSADIDIEQYKFFADIADGAIGPEDAVIIVNHEPHWITDFEDGRLDDDRSEQNIRELMHSHLKGKVRLRLAGDLHHYTRHVPVRKPVNPTQRRSRSRSFSFDETNKTKNSANKVEPFTEENRPELIVSGGGGAFLVSSNVSIWSISMSIFILIHNFKILWNAYNNTAWNSSLQQKHSVWRRET